MISSNVEPIHISVCLFLSNFGRCEGCSGNRYFRLEGIHRLVADILQHMVSEYIAPCLYKCNNLPEVFKPAVGEKRELDKAANQCSATLQFQNKCLIQSIVQSVLVLKQIIFLVMEIERLLKVTQ